MNRIPKHPGKPQGSDTVPAWLTPGEFVMNAEAARMFSPEIQAMNDRGRAVQAAQGGTIPQMGGVPIPTTHNPSAAYNEGGDVGSEEPAWKQHIRTREGGLKRKIYIDTEGYATVGIGHKLPDSYKSQEGQSPFSDSELNNFFEADVAQATANAQHNVSSFNTLTVPQQGGLINQAFQLGRTGQSKFKNMIKAINEGNMTEAGAQALDSKWHGQTPNRSTDLSRVLQGQETKMEYNRGGGVPQYLGLGDWVKSLFVNDDEEKLNPNFFDIVGKEGIPSTLGIPMAPYNMDEYNKHNFISPPKVQTEINTDGSYFNQPYGTDSDRMDSGFKVPEPPQYSDAALENNSSKALQDVPYASLPDPDLGALITQGDKTAEEVMKQRANESQFGVPVNMEDGMHPDMFMKDFPKQGDPRRESQFGVPVNMEDGMDTDMFNRDFTDPRIGATENYSVPADPDLYDPRRGVPEVYGNLRNAGDLLSGSGVSLNEDARATVPSRFMDPRTKRIPTGPASYEIPPKEQKSLMDNVKGFFDTSNAFELNPISGKMEEKIKGTDEFIPTTISKYALQPIENQVTLAEKREKFYEEQLKIATTEKGRKEALKQIEKANKDKIKFSEIINSNIYEQDKINTIENKMVLDDEKLKLAALRKERNNATNPIHVERLDELINESEKFVAEGKSEQRSGDSATNPILKPIVEGGDGDKNLETTETETPDLNLENPDGTVKPDLVVSGNNATPEAKGAAVDQIKGVFGEMFDVQELTRMAILYLGARATGATGNQALAFAGKHYLKRLDNKYKQNKFNEHYNELLKGNNMTRDSMELYKYTKDPNVLAAKSSLQKGSVSGDPKGEVFYTKANVRGVRGQKLKLFQRDEVDSTGKKTGNTFYTTSGGTPISQQQLEMYFTSDASTIPGTDKYIESRNKVATGLRPVITEKIAMFKPTDTDKGNPAMYKIVGNHKEKITMEVANFSKDLQLKEGQMVTSNIIENAFKKLQGDIDGGFYDDVKTITFTDYLNLAYIDAKVGSDEKYFKYNTPNGKSKTDSAKEVDLVLDGLTEGVKSKGGDKWKNTPDIVINDLLLKQAKFKLNSMNKQERVKFNAAYQKSIKTNPQSEMLFFLETEKNELIYDDYFKRET